MHEHDFRWAIVVLFHQRPTRLAEKAVAALMPKRYIEFVLSDDLTDWKEDREGVDYGPRWEGDLGVRGDVEMRRREKAREDAAAALAARIQKEEDQAAKSALIAARNRAGRSKLRTSKKKAPGE